MSQNVRNAALAAIAVATLASGCASSSSTSKSASSGAPAGGSTNQTGPTNTAGSTVKVALTGGTLTAPDGHTLYFNTVDTAAKIQCATGCVADWPPLTGTPSAGKGLAGSAFATATRPDGSTQVTYFGHPLYEFSGDTGPGSTMGAGVADGGGTWLTATPAHARSGGSGGASAPASGATSDDSGGGGGYP